MCMKAEDIEKRQTALAERQMCDPTKIKEATQLILNSPETHEQKLISATH